MEEWQKTNGKEPTDWEDYDYIWIYCPKNVCPELIEAFGCIEWESYTHWMPAEIEPPRRPLDELARPNISSH